MHAQHLKHIIATIIPGWAGAVVYIDNENSESLDLRSPGWQPLRDYYLALLDELARPGPEGAPPMRAALYLHAPVARPLLRERPDLFVWDVQIDVADLPLSTTTRAPFNLAAARIEIGLPLTVRAAVVPSEATGHAWFAWPTGRQFRFYTGNLPQRGSTAARTHPTLVPTSTFDFDASLVRDPAFPIAEPRIAPVSGRAEPTVVLGSFTEPTRSGRSAHSAAMDLSVVGNGARASPLASATGLELEPDSPVLAVPTQLPDTLLAVTIHNTVVERRLITGTWTTWRLVGQPPPALRRLRTIAAVKRPDGTTYLFTVSTDHRLYAQRRGTAGAWSAPAPMAGPLRLHPFSMLAATVRADQVEVLGIDSTGALFNAWWSPLATTWPGDAHTLVAGAPSTATAGTPGLLVGSALVVVAPSATSLLAFGIGRDLRLTLAEFRTGIGWQALRALGQTDDRVTPHARVVAQVVSPNLVEVAAISHDLGLVIHRLHLSQGRWESDQPVTLTAIPPVAAPGASALRQRDNASSATQPAIGWSINPFGEVALGRTSGARSFVVVPGLPASAPRTAALGCFLDSQQWWSYR